MFTDASVVGCTWVALAARLDRQGVVSRWADSAAELAGVSCVADLLVAWNDPGRSHRVGDALVRLAAADGGDDRDAMLVVLHLASPVVWRLVGQLGDLDRDVPAIVLAELCCQVRSYRWRTRRGGLLSNLELDTRSAVLADLRPSSRTHPDRVERLSRTGDIDRFASSDSAALSADPAEVLARALSCGVPRRHIHLLLASELARHQPTRAELAAAYGITTRTVQRWRAGMLARLREALDAA